MASRISLLIVSLALSACETQSLRVPATIEDLTIIGHEEISNKISSALQTEKVVIGRQVFLTSNLLIIEQRIPRQVDRMKPDGRRVIPPHQFFLYLEDESCVLLHEQSKVAYHLEHVSCKAE